jgi:membrane associated rhomboid family serine protease
MNSMPRYRFNWRTFLPPGIRNIVLACTFVYLMQTVLGIFGGPAASFRFIEWFGLVPRAVTHGLRLWQPFTYLFLHGGLWHLLINMLVLWMFGADLERAWGTRRFYTYYFLTGVGAGLIDVVVKTILDPHGVGTFLLGTKISSWTPTIGASGAIFGVLLATAMIFPDRQVWLIPFPVTIPMRMYVVVMGGIEFFSTLGASGDNVSHVCHLGGMLVGYFYLRRGSYLFGVRNRYSDWRRRNLRRRFDVYQARHRDDPPSNPSKWTN